MNDIKPAGTYEAGWDAVDMPRGVYFYKLQSGTYTETKKLILIR